MGPICAGKVIELSQSAGITDKVDLPFDIDKMDIICRREEDGLHFNINQVFRHHSPTGMEWGYVGSGPADFALNIVELFMREYPDMPCVEIWDKQLVTMQGWRLHQPFKDQFVAKLPREGGVIKGDVIRSWVAKERKSQKR